MQRPTHRLESFLVVSNDEFDSGRHVDGRHVRHGGRTRGDGRRGLAAPRGSGLGRGVTLTCRDGNLLTPSLASTTVTQILTGYTLTSQMPQYTSFDSSDWEPLLRSVARYSKFFGTTNFPFENVQWNLSSVASFRWLVCGVKIRQFLKYRKKWMEMTDFSVIVYLDFPFSL